MSTDTTSSCRSNQATQIKTGAIDQFSHLPNLQHTIMKFIVEQPQSDVGIHIPIITEFISKNGVNDTHKIMYEHNFFTLQLLSIIDMNQQQFTEHPYR